MIWLAFFFQAEDGIRDVAVTGVQTCALPISPITAAIPAAASFTRGSGITGRIAWTRPAAPLTDRKSTRLNSSHGYISYAVFCLKKKKKQQQLSENDVTATQEKSS